MNTCYFEGIDLPLAYREESQPAPEAIPDGHALIHLHYAALNHRDLWIRKGQYAKIKAPCVLGSDGAGFWLNPPAGQWPHHLGAISAQTPVVINPSLGWGNDPKCQSSSYEILGMPSNGTLAKWIVVPANQVYPLPVHLSLAEGAALPLAGLTAYRALFTRGQLQVGEKVLITGIGGGVAQMALMLAAAVGAEVYVSSSDEAKIMKAVANGAKAGANYHQDIWKKALLQQLQSHSNAGGFDLIIDSAGGPGFGDLVDLAASGGRIVVFGGTAGNYPDLQPAKVFWKQLSILGSTMGSDQEFRDMLALVAQHQLVPTIDQIFEWDAIEAAFERIESGQQWGKIVVQIRSEA
jgi:zinc-binding alcohol dehydrogenase/oxidoreductase